MRNAEEDEDIGPQGAPLDICLEKISLTKKLRGRLQNASLSGWWNFFMNFFFDHAMTTLTSGAMIVSPICHARLFY